jgi:peptidoglycan/LPS O-acetylase OafA/YrhL
MYDDRVPLTERAAAMALAALVIVTAAGQFRTLGALPFGYLLMWLAVRLPFDSFGSRDDISYGLYIYAFVVQQMLAQAGVQRAGVVVFIMASLALTAVPAWLSWRLVERPAKDWSARRIRARQVAVPLQTTAEPTTSTAVV